VNITLQGHASLLPPMSGCFFPSVNYSYNFPGVRLHLTLTLSVTDLFSFSSGDRTFSLPGHFCSGERPQPRGAPRSSLRFTSPPKGLVTPEEAQYRFPSLSRPLLSPPDVGPAPKAFSLSIISFLFAEVSPPRFFFFLHVFCTRDLVPRLG